MKVLNHYIVYGKMGSPEHLYQCDTGWWVTKDTWMGHHPVKILVSVSEEEALAYIERAESVWEDNREG